MAYLSQEQVRQILTNAPANLDKTKLVAELAKTNTLQGYNDQTAHPQDGFFKSLIKDPLKELIVRPADRIARAGTYIAAPLLSKIPGAASTDEIRRRTLEDTSNVSLPVLGDFQTGPQKAGAAGLKQIGGDALKTASYLYTPGAVSEVAAGARTLGQTALRAGVQGAKAGALAGGTYGLGDAFQQNKGFKDTAKETTIGALTGGAIGGFSAAALSVVSNLPQKVKDSTVKKYDELFSGTRSGKTLLDKSAAQGKNPSKFLVDNNFIVDVEKGKVNAASTIEKIRAQAESYDSILDEILKAKDETVGTNTISLDDLADMLKKKLRTPQNEASGYMNTQLKAVENIISDLKDQFGDTVNLQQLNQIKQAQWRQASVFDLTRPNYQTDIHYNFGSVAKQAIEDHIPQADVKGLNNYIGDHYNAIKNLMKVDGKAVKGGRLGNYFGRVVGSIAGATHGPIGSIVGAKVGDSVSTIMQNNYLSNPIKKILLARITETEPAGSVIVQEAEKALSVLQADPLYKVPSGVTSTSVAVPQKLEYFKPNSKKLIKVNTYRPDNTQTFPKYIVPKNR